MPAITPVPATRISDQLIRQRLTSQLRFDQREIFKIQSALASGRRIALPSEDAPAALRAVSLQSLLERKTQVRQNVTTNQSYLSSTDTAVSNVSKLLADVRGTAVGVTGVTAGATQRLAAAQEVDRAIQQLLDVGGQQFRGRYLFAGTQTNVAPVTDDGGFIRYDGDEGNLLSYSDIDVLFPTNQNAQQVFGVLSDAVRGEADLNPRLTSATRISDLRGGLGVSPGSIEISDGTRTTIVDLSQAETIGQIQEILQQQALLPTRALTATINDTGLSLVLDTPGGGNLTVREVGGGTTAGELGLLQDQPGFGTGPIVGTDLDPRLTLTTQLSDVLGIPASARVVSAGGNNDLRFEAATRGTSLAGVTISFTAGAAGSAGSETAVYNAAAKTLVVTVESGVSTANQVINAVNREGTFRARRDLSESPNSGTGVIQATSVDPTATAITAIDLDLSAGLQIRNGNQTHTPNLTGLSTVEDLLNRLNGSSGNVRATINATSNGIDLRSRLSGADFGVGENGGRLATFLGLRSFTEQSRLEELNHGLGVHTANGDDLRITRLDGTTLDIDLSTAQTVQDVLDAINLHPNNDPLDANPIGKVVARLAAFGNGIELVSVDPATTAALTVTRLNFSEAAIDLGFVDRGQTTSTAATFNGSASQLTGRDVRPLEVDGVYNALIRLRDALQDDDTLQIERAIGILDESSERVNFSRAELGARQQGLDVLELRLDSEELELKSALSREIDTDVVAAISEFTARQIAYEASLRTASQIFQLTLLNFL